MAKNDRKQERMRITGEGGEGDGLECSRTVGCLAVGCIIEDAERNELRTANCDSASLSSPKRCT